MVKLLSSYTQTVNVEESLMLLSFPVRNACRSLEDELQFWRITDDASRLSGFFFGKVEEAQIIPKSRRQKHIINILNIIVVTTIFGNALPHRLKGAQNGSELECPLKMVKGAIDALQNMTKNMLKILVANAKFWKRTRLSRKYKQDE